MVTLFNGYLQRCYAMRRYIEKNVCSDLKEKMVFVGGPRQVGKTTFALGLLKNGSEEHPAYLNWDFPETRASLIQGNIPAGEKLLILDEIHKYKDWRNLVKGLYDKYKRKISFLITGSARLDYYRRGGDSLQGRYHFYRLHPITVGELGKHPNMGDVKQLLEFGGFPEPFLKEDKTVWRRWQRERIKRVIYEDLVGLEKVREVSRLELLASTLESKVGSPLSVKSVREDLQVAHETAEKWLQIFENLYICNRIMPFGGKTIRAVKKEKKLYLWDWSLCMNKGARFENFVFSHLLKYCHFIEDTEGYAMEVRFIRDFDKREIDFVVLKDSKPIFAVECKSGDGQLSRHIKYFSKRLDIPVFYQVHLGNKDFENMEYRARVLPFIKFSQELRLP